MRGLVVCGVGLVVVVVGGSCVVDGGVLDRMPYIAWIAYKEMC